MFWVMCVLKSGGDYDTDYVKRLWNGIRVYLPGAHFVCLSDVPLPCPRIELKYNWPGWWSKMELFRPEIGGDILYFDLDTIITGPITNLAKVNRLTVLDNWKGDGGIGSGLMYIPECDRAEIWKAFTANVDSVIEDHSNPKNASYYGDQGFLAKFWEERAARWQILFPGRILSYKWDHVAECGLTEKAWVVCFHGRPRPRDIQWRISGFQPLLNGLKV